MAFIFGLNPFTGLLDITADTAPSGPFILKDGTSTTTASIPFASGLSAPNASSYPRFDLGATGVVRWLGDATHYGQVNIVGTSTFLIQGALVDISVAAPEKKDLYLSAGDSDTSYGIVRTGDSFAIGPHPTPNLANRPLFFVEGALEVDGVTRLDGTVNLSTQTASRFLKTDGSKNITSSAASTIDISSETNLAVTLPITLTGDTVGFDFSQNNTWTGTNLFAKNITIKDDFKLYIGDNSIGFGNVSIVNDASSTGEILITPENGFASDIELLTGIGLRVADNITAGSSSHLTLQTFGATLSSAAINPAGSTDGVHVRKQSTSAGIRALSVQAEFLGNGTAFSSNINGFNAFAYSATGNLSAMTTTANGGGLRSRSVARHRATNVGATVALMSGGSFSCISDASTATVTESRQINIEAPNIGLGGLTTTWKGINFEAGVASGTCTNAYQLYIPALLHGTNKYEQWMDTTAAIYFRESTQKIYSSGSTILDVDAPTLNLRTSGTTLASFNGSTLTFADAKNIAFNTTTGTKIGTSTFQKIGFYNATPVVQTTGSTDVLAGLVTVGLRAASSNPPLNLGTGAITCGNLTHGDGTNVIVGSTTGTKIGTATTQKLGFWNVTPVVQPSAYTQTYATATKTHSNPTATSVSTTGSTNVAPFGYTTAAQADAIVTAINALITDLANVKQVLNAVIDDDQAIGIKA